MNISVSIDGLEISRRAFQTLNDALTDFRGVWPELHSYFLRGQAEQFESFGARGGQQWKPLSERYAKWKAKHYPGKPIMVKTERLKQSLTTSSSEQVREFQPMYAIFGTMVPYARYHQYGTSRLPKRPLIQPTQKDVDRMVSRIYRYAQNSARGAGFATTGRARQTPGAN